MVKKEDKQTTYVYIKDKNHAWVPAILDDSKGDKAFCTVPQYPNEQAMKSDGGRGAKGNEQVTVSLKDYPHQVLPLQNVDANGNLIEFADMVKLPYLHEAGILYNLKKRHEDGKPYTRTGDIVIAVNPFQWFTDLYTEKKRTYYSNRLVWEASQDDPRDGMEPHVYEVSSLAYKGLAFGKEDQSILVSGESGAGKTETVKIAMNHMASVQQGPKGALAGDTQELDPVVRRVVQSNPLLEAFGNASTRRNDNSSRFGKYLQLQFDQTKQKGMDVVTRSVSTCTLAGSKCEVYLLEKNRICYHESEERTYHVFYQILSAPDDQKTRFWKKLKGTTLDSFKYVGATKRTKIEGLTDAQHFQNTVDTLALVGVKNEKLDMLMRAICVVLQCGNLTFGPLKGDSEKSDVTSKRELADLAELMGVDETTLTLAFTERTMKTKDETYKVPLKVEFAKDSADALAKEIYGKVFLWVVREVNAATCAEENYKDGSMDEFGIIGLLDIFGFESFVTNRFEQLCINYANEKLQQKFTEDVFRSVQAEYEAEGIELAEIKFDDNTDVLDLIEARTGLLAMLNEECVRPKGNDQDFVQKAINQNKKSPCLIVNKLDRMSFGVHHYAGKVMYDADGFVSANQDTLPTDLEDLMMKSSIDIIREKILPPSTSGAANGGRRAAPKRQKSNIVGDTVWNKYKTQLSSLMTSLRKTNSRYIRCIKPNMRKVPVVMEHIPAVEQLRCAGVVAAVTLARSAFPNRLENSAVRFRYSSMWNKDVYPSEKTGSMDHDEALRCDCRAIMTSALKEKEYVNKEGKTKQAFVVGKTKTYFRAGALEFLEANRQTGLDAQAITIQRYARGFLTRKQFADQVNAATRREQEERERREREERERIEREQREKAERDEKRAKDSKKYEEQMAYLKRKLQEADDYFEKKMSDAMERKKIAEDEIEELREKTSEKARKALMEPKKIMAVQTKKLQEQTKMIDHLKKENKKVRKEHDKIKEKYDVVKENNEKLLKANENTGEDFEELNDVAGQVSDKNEELLESLEKAKKDNKRLKDDCMKRQDDYMAQAETRLEYQKTMARILNLIQEKGQTANLGQQVVEDTVCLALECEAESKTIMAALEAETDDY